MPQSAYPTTTRSYDGASVGRQPAYLAGDQLGLVVQQRRAAGARRPASRDGRTISLRAGRSRRRRSTRRPRTASSPLRPNAELVDEAVVEVGAVGELDIRHLLQQRLGAGALAQREQRHLRALAGDVAGGDDAQHRQLRAPARCGRRRRRRGSCRTSRRAAPAGRRGARGRAPRAAASSRSRSRPWRTAARGRRAGTARRSPRARRPASAGAARRPAPAPIIGEPVGQRGRDLLGDVVGRRSGPRRRAARP